MKLTENELYEISGGAFSLSAAFLEGIAKCIDTLFELGRKVGTAIRRVNENKICPIP